MISIKIKSNIKLSDIDNLYNALYRGIRRREEIDVILPKRLSKNFFSITSSLIQFISTWIRCEHASRLIIDIKPEVQGTIHKMYEEEFFFPIIALAWNDVSIENLKGDNLRPLLRNYQNEFILKMRRIEAIKGEKLLLVNLDHFNNSTGLLPFFETKNSFVINETNLVDSLREPILKNVLKFNKNARNDFKEIYHDVIGIIYELMKNTYEWAKEDEFNVPLFPNIRGLYIRFYKKDRTQIQEDYKTEKAICEYFSKENVIKNNNLNQVYFIEISVFDSGSGFIKKFIKESDSDSLTDVDIIKKCLIKNQTSSNSIFKKDKGLGLDRILQILNKKGLLRIKTDKYCLYRDLIDFPYHEVEKEKYHEMELFDWNLQSNNDYSKINYSSGSNISILYPLPQSPKTV